MSMMINWGVSTLHVKRVDSEAERRHGICSEATDHQSLTKLQHSQLGQISIYSKNDDDDDADAVVVDNGVLKRFTFLFRGAKVYTSKFANMQIGKSKNV